MYGCLRRMRSDLKLQQFKQKLAVAAWYGRSDKALVSRRFFKIHLNCETRQRHSPGRCASDKTTDHACCNEHKRFEVFNRSFEIDMFPEFDSGFYWKKNVFFHATRKIEPMLCLLPKSGDQFFFDQLSQITEA